MRCHNAKSLISRSFDEALREFDRSRLEDHLQTCVDCSTHLRVLERGRDLLQSGSHAEPSENFEWKVQLGIQKAMRDAARERYSITPRAPFWRPMLSGALAMAALVIALGVTLLPRMQSGVPEGDATALGDAGAPDVSGAQPVEIVDPIYVNSRGGRFVSGSGGGAQTPWVDQGANYDELVKAVAYWRKVAFDQDLLIQRLHSQNEQLKLQIESASGEQR